MRFERLCLFFSAVSSATSATEKTCFLSQFRIMKNLNFSEQRMKNFNGTFNSQLDLKRSIGSKLECIANFLWKFVHVGCTVYWIFFPVCLARRPWRIFEMKLLLASITMFDEIFIWKNEESIVIYLPCTILTTMFEGLNNINTNSSGYGFWD